MWRFLWSHYGFLTKKNQMRYMLIDYKVSNKQLAPPSLDVSSKQALIFYIFSKLKRAFKKKKAYKKAHCYFKYANNWSLCFFRWPPMVSYQPRTCQWKSSMLTMASLQTSPWSLRFWLTLTPVEDGDRFTTGWLRPPASWTEWHRCV